MDSETEAVVLAHLQATDGPTLARAATGMSEAYDALWRLRGRIAGLRVDTITSWDSASGESVRGHLETIEGALASLGGQLSLMSEKVRAHAALVEPTREDVRAEILRSYTEGPSLDATEDVGYLLYPFHESEKALTEALWEYGALAPGEIPLPEPPPRPDGDWKTFLLGDDFPDYWFWVDEDGDPLGPDDDAPYGYDEWGELVPAYQAAMPVPGQYQEAGIPVGPLLRMLTRAGKLGGAAASGARAIAPSADDLAALVRSSYGWRSSHIDRHIREWYRLADDAPVQPWMRDEYLRLVVESGTRQGKVFQWSLRGEQGAQPTASVLRYDQASRRWLVSQYYLGGERAGEFATAFAPTARQLARMLQQSAIG